MKCKYWNVTSHFSLATSAIWNSIVWWPKTDSSLSCRYYRIKQVVKLRDNVIQSEEIYNEFWKTCFYAFFFVYGLGIFSNSFLQCIKSQYGVTEHLLSMKYFAKFQTFNFGFSVLLCFDMLPFKGSNILLTCQAARRFNHVNDEIQSCKWFCLAIHFSTVQILMIGIFKIILLFQSSEK